MQNAVSKGNPRRICSFLPVAAPWLLLGLISLILGKNAFRANPVWSDEIVYYRMLKSICGSGWPTAANGTFEATAVFGNLGSTGLVPLLLYVPFGKLFGVTPQTILLSNAVWVSLAALVFVLLCKPSFKISLILTAALIGYVPFILYSTTAMTEIFSYALLLFYLAFLISYCKKPNVGMLVLCILTCILAGLVRSYYGWLVVPLAFCICRFRMNGKTLLILLALLILEFLCCLFGECFISTNYNSFLYRLLHADNLYYGWRMLLSHVKSNLLDVFSRNECRPIELLVLFGYTLMMLMTMIGGIIGSRGEAHERQPRMDLIIISLTMAALLLTIICLYDLRDWRGFRMLSPILWIVMIYTIYRGDCWNSAVAGVIYLALLIVLLVGPAIGAFADQGRFATAPKSEALTQATQSIPYCDEVDNDFRNTVRTDLYSLQLADELDTRLGVQYGWLSTDTVEKSHWLITDYLRCAITGYRCVADFGDYKVYEQMNPEEATE